MDRELVATSGAADGSSQVEAVLSRMYARLGPWYVAPVVVATAVSLTMGVAIAVASVGVFAHASAIKLVKFSLAAELLGACGLGIALGAHWTETMRVLRWPSAPSRAEAPAAWHAVAAFATRLIRTGIAAFLVLFVPYAIWVTSDLFPAHWWTVIPIYAIAVTAILFSAMLDYFAITQMMRPVLRDVVQHLPPSFEVEHRPIRLRTRVLGIMFLVSLSSALVAAAAEGSVSTPTDRLAIGVGIGLAVAATVGLLPAIALARSEELSQSALAKGARRVERGELDTTIPLLSVDETASVALSFNRMVAGLREREALRDRNVELIDELRASRERIVASADAERRRLERDLHDGAQQHLVLVQMKLGLLERALSQTPEAERVTELKADLTRALEELRDLAHGIYPAVLENEGLAGALREAAARSAIETTVEAEGAGRLPVEVENAVYYCCLEALQNSAKHAGPGALATVRLGVEPGIVRFEVSDNGAGFDAHADPAPGGLRNMADRIGALGGELEIASTPGEGTTVRGSAPTAA